MAIRGTSIFTGTNTMMTNRKDLLAWLKVKFFASCGADFVGGGFPALHIDAFNRFKTFQKTPWQILIFR